MIWGHFWGPSFPYAVYMNLKEIQTITSYFSKFVRISHAIRFYQLMRKKQIKQD